MSFPCPECGKSARVVDTRLTKDECRFSVYRRLRCPKNHRFTTYEMLAEKKRNSYAEILGSVNEDGQAMKDFVSVIKTSMKEFGLNKRRKS